MIALDNGPAGGDYVRYIDALLAQRAAAALAPGAGSAPTFVDATRIMPQVPWPLPATKVAARPTPGERARLSASQAGALASVLMSQAHGQPSVDGPWLELIGIAIGGAIVVAGFFAPTFSALFVLAGVGLVYAMFRRLVARPVVPRDPG